jgi:transcriptional regulator with XRE-family HTH domain
MIVRQTSDTEIADLSQRIKTARKTAKLSLAALGKRTGVTAQYLSQIEKGKIDVVSIEIVKKIQVATECNFIDRD